MKPDRWGELESLFHEVLALPPTERAARLARAPEDLAQEVGRLVLAADTTGSTLHQLRDAAAAVLGDVQLEPGQELGGFEVVAPLGRGGMGAVYLAAQEQPKRHVALKVLASGLGSTGRARRFEVEADLLARLRHPAIAHVYAAGVLREDEQRLPWFAMELVEGGRALTEAARGLDLDQRLDLFTQFCDGVQHAHERGVIHRDLKPSNMLVDAEGRPRLIDFGIALVTGGASEEAGAVGTPAYMSPEQARGEEVDTRSDVFALGVVLAELVPDAGRSLRAVIDRARHADREYRYASAAALAQDLEAYRARRPVAAVGSGVGYRVACWTRRSRGLATVTALGLIVLTGMAWGWIGARNERLAAEQRAHDARVELEQLLVVLEEIDPYAPDSQGLQDEVIARIQARLDDDDLTPRMQAELHDELGRILITRGWFQEGEQHLHRAVATYEDEYGVGSPEAFGARQGVLGSLLHSGRLEEVREPLERHVRIAREEFGEFSREHLRALLQQGWLLSYENRTQDAACFHRDLIDHCVRELGEDDAVTYTAKYNHACNLRRLGERTKAEPLMREVVAWRRKELGYEHLETLSAQIGLASILDDKEELTEALLLFEDTYEAYARVLPEDNPDSAMLKNNYAACLRKAQRHEEAFAIYREALDTRSRIFGEHHSYTRLARNNFAVANLDKAISIANENARRAREAPEGTTVEKRPLTPYVDVARDLFEELLATEHLMRDSPREPHVHKTSCRELRAGYANYLQCWKRWDEALQQYDDALALTDPDGNDFTTPGAPAWITLSAHRAACIMNLGRLDEARDLFDGVEASFEGNPEVTATHREMMRRYRAQLAYLEGQR